MSWFVWNMWKERVLADNLTEQEANDIADRYNDRVERLTGSKELFYIPDCE